jgi:hypothetical protein
MRVSVRVRVWVRVWVRVRVRVEVVGSSMYADMDVTLALMRSSSVSRSPSCIICLVAQTWRAG